MKLQLLTLLYALVPDLMGGPITIRIRSVDERFVLLGQQVDVVMIFNSAVKEVLCHVASFIVSLLVGALELLRFPYGLVVPREIELVLKNFGIPVLSRCILILYLVELVLDAFKYVILPFVHLLFNIIIYNKRHYIDIFNINRVPYLIFK